MFRGFLDEEEDWKKSEDRKRRAETTEDVEFEGERKEGRGRR